MTATTSAETTADRTEAEDGSALRPRSTGKGPRERMASTASSIAMIIIGLAFLVPLLWVVLASSDPQATLSVQWPERWSMEN